MTDQSDGTDQNGRPPGPGADCTGCGDRCAACPRVVAIGGGHGHAVTIRAVRTYAGAATAVVATADNGGSTGRLRSGLRIPAPGDLRRCMVAMAGAEHAPWGEALEHRFPGTDVEGHALGNLMLAGLEAATGDFLVATAMVAGVLGLDPDRHLVLPATCDPVDLWARTAAGGRVEGQVVVSGTRGIAEVGLSPAAPKAAPGVVDALAAADQIVLGPGDLYTSVLAAAVVPEVRAAVAASRARVVYVCNLQAVNAESRGYSVVDHVEALRRHGVDPDAVVVDTSLVDSELVDTRTAVGRPVVGGGAEVVVAEVARPHGLAHDHTKLAPVLSSLVG